MFSTFLSQELNNNIISVQRIFKTTFHICLLILCGNSKKFILVMKESPIRDIISECDFISSQDIANSNIISIISVFSDAWLAALDFVIQLENGNYDSKDIIKRMDKYSNSIMLNPEGEKISLISKDQAKWYLEKELAVLEKKEPFTIRLNFEPKGEKTKKDKYYLTYKESVCVVCGAHYPLSRHHVIPYSFRRLMPERVKRKAHHDILLLCDYHHEAYEKEANAYKISLARKYNLPEELVFTDVDAHKKEIYDAAQELLQSEKILAKRKRSLAKKIRDYYGIKYLTKKYLNRASKINFRSFKANCKTRINFSEEVIKRIKSLQDFSVGWREHFLRTMNPRFLPKYWDVNKRII